jgi:hypothetical protein
MATVLEFKRPEPPAPAKPAKAGRKVWHHPTKEYVRAEAECAIASDGAPNVYTSYLKLYGRYPSPQQARAMGLKLGRRVRADDGKHYPPKTTAEKEHDREVRARRKEAYRILEAVLNAQQVVHSLNSIDASVDEVIGYCDEHPMFGDGAAIEQGLEAGLDWLQHFAVAWRARHPIKQDI